MDDAVQMALLFDYYGGLLTERQRQCFELRYNQDLSLGEIAGELGVSRQGVFDNLTRAEALLQNMEAQTGCVRRDLAHREASRKIRLAAQALADSELSAVAEKAREILRVLDEYKE